MNLKERQAAVRTAGERLEALETWARRTFIATLATTILISLMALIGMYGAFEYMRIRWAMSEAQTAMAKSLDSMRADTQHQHAIR